jgi:hypothetical protein
MSQSKPPSKTSPVTVDPAKDSQLLMKRHLRFGWWTLLVFLTLGLVLEGLHGLKAGFYLSVTNETRRLMWTLAHAHGTLLALVNLGFASTIRLLPDWPARGRGLASACLRASTLLMPAGFFLGGAVIYSGDPGLGIILLPVGGLLLLAAVFLTARAVSAK